MALNYYLSRSLENFIDAAIMRCSDTGDTWHRFNLLASQIREATGRQRLHDDVIVDFFRSFGVNCSPNPRIGIYEVTLDLNSCILSPSQAGNFATAKSHYHSLG